MKLTIQTTGKSMKKSFYNKPGQTVPDSSNFPAKEKVKTAQIIFDGGMIKDLRGRKRDRRVKSEMESAPTGCFKCGRPGHWSRDCPSSAPVAGNNSVSSSSAPSQIPNNEFQRSSSKSGTSIAPAPKVTKTRVQRPKLTPELLLSEDGLGYVLRYFPKSFNEWHTHLLPYYSFDHFVHKVQQVASTKRVKNCINELRERVASGVDPNKLYEKQEENTVPSDDQDMDQPSHDEENIPSKSVDADTNADAFEDSMLNEIFDNASKLPSDEQNMDKSSELTEEQRARMEANRLKAMEKAQNISEEQRVRMEANRLKALERAKARLQPNQD
ncbi:putative CCHC-type zinc finger protein [Arabidopsis thaliana]|uniref:Putative CCHC-type zinc finger protein n=1 Tax=Arabidopsis thaliana TaxID=3702 RepID=Q9M8S3_ARATH|nr:putative CCHC-type zinc finger protein [Arabidopsis thaliana]